MVCTFTWGPVTQAIDSAQLGTKATMDSNDGPAMITRSLIETIHGDPLRVQALQHVLVRTPLAEVQLCSATRMFSLSLPDAQVKRALESGSLVIIAEECLAAASETDELFRLGGSCATVAYGSSFSKDHSLRPRLCVSTCKPEVGTEAADEAVSYQFGSFAGDEFSGAHELMCCLRAANSCLSSWDCPSQLARVLRHLPRGNDTHATLEARCSLLVKLRDDVFEALRCESLEQLDDLIERCSHFHGWLARYHELYDRRCLLTTAARTLGKALRPDCHDEELIITARRAASAFSAFRADVISLGERLAAVRQSLIAALADVQVPDHSALHQLVPQLALPDADETVAYRMMSEMGRVIEALAGRLEAAQLFASKMPWISASAMEALHHFVAPIARTAESPWPRELLIFVRRCAEEERITTEWLRRHFGPIRESLALIDQASESQDAQVVMAAARCIRRHGEGFKKTKLALESQAMDITRGGGQLADEWAEQLTTPVRMPSTDTMLHLPDTASADVATTTPCHIPRGTADNASVRLKTTTPVKMGTVTPAAIVASPANTADISQRRQVLLRRRVFEAKQSGDAKLLHDAVASMVKLGMHAEAAELKRFADSVAKARHQLKRCAPTLPKLDAL